MPRSPSMFVTPPTSPPSDSLPQTPTPKKRSPSTSLFRTLDLGADADDDEVEGGLDMVVDPRTWGASELLPGASESKILGLNDDFMEDSDSPATTAAEEADAAEEETEHRENHVPSFHGSFLSDLDDAAMGEPTLDASGQSIRNSAAAPTTRHSASMLQSHSHQQQSQLEAPFAGGSLSSGMHIPGAQGLKSPRIRGLHFGEGNDLVEMNFSNISMARKQPASSGGGGLNLSMPVPHRPLKSPGRVPHLNVTRSPGKGHSVSMMVTRPGPALGDEDTFLKTRQPLAVTPRGVATNPFQVSPKSTMGSAKKKSRTAVSGRSRYMQDFEERSKIGAGNFSEVYECQHRMDGMTYAVKVLKEELSAPRLTKVMSEVFALAALPAHDNLIRYYGCWTENNRLYIQTELCEAGNLESKLKGQHRFTEEQLCDVLRQVLAGLAHIHKGGLCHLDIKPENILITYVKHGVAREPVYKIGDLGLVMKSDLKDKFHTDVEGGDGRYMSPELMEGDADKLMGNLEKSDVWSLGCTVYALARREELPVGGDEYQEIRAGKLRLPQNEYSPAFVDLLRRMICPDVTARLSATQLLRQPLLQTREVRRYKQAKAKKRKLKSDLASKEKELAELRQNLAVSMERIAALQSSLNRAEQEVALDARFQKMYSLLEEKLGGNV